MSDVVVDTGTVNYEELAGRQGWKPQDQWSGDATRWKPAKQFYEDGMNHLPMLQAKNKRLEERLNQVQATLGQLVKTANEERAEMRGALETEKESKRVLLTQLAADKARAISDADGVKVVGIETQMEGVKQEIAAIDHKSRSMAGTGSVGINPNDPQVQQAFQLWAGKNANWYGKDIEATTFANSLAQVKQNMTPGVNADDVFEYVSLKIQEKYPEYFEDTNDNDGRPASPEPVTRTATVGRNRDVAKHSYDDLPMEAKRLCDMVVRDAKLKRTPDGKPVNYTRDMYVAEYFGTSN